MLDICLLLSVDQVNYYIDYYFIRTINFRLNLKTEIEIVWTPTNNGRESLVKEVLPVDITRKRGKRKATKIMEEPSDGLHEKQKHER